MRFRIRPSLTLLSFFTINFCIAQVPVDYNDVGLIINKNSQVSQNIGTYFKNARNIPQENLLYIDAPTKETIDSLEFSAIQKQIKDSLVNKGLDTKLNYLVTTKGVPLRVCRDTACDQMANYTGSASVDAEIALIAGVGEDKIGNSGALVSNYFTKNAHFSKAQWGHFIVTRLTGYTEQDVINLIDRSGPNTLVNIDKVKFVLDGVGSGGFANTGYNLELPDVSIALDQRGWKDTLNMDNTYVKNQDSVFGYWSWGSNHPNVDNLTAIPQNSWVKGSIAETAVSTSARTFTKPTGNWQSLVADWIAEGVTGMAGYVYEPKLFSVAHPAALFERYTRPGMDWPFNLGESYYMASYTLGWMQVVVVDPKTSIVTEIPDIPTPQIDPVASTHCNSGSLNLTAQNVLPGRRNWFLGDTATILAVGPPYNFNHPNWLAFGNSLTANLDSILGNYTLTFVNENFVVVGATQVEFTVEVCDDIEEISLDHKINIYPNPSNGLVTIEQLVSTEEEITAALFNATGQQVWKADLGFTPAQTFDIGHLPRGIYIMILQGENEQTTKQLVLN